MQAFVYDTAQIIKWLGSKTVAKARTYVDEVTRLHWDEDVLRANVQGTQRRPYTVEVMFHDHHGSLSAQGHCSCPVGFGCKHAAAVLLASASDRPRESETVRAEAAAWLSRICSCCDNTPHAPPKKNLHAQCATVRVFL